ncbi:GNAT family N-acetyltransferase [Burkholderia puraquae]|uniref:Amino-acid acetyltransferase n=1 Tax=Burkholderia puraquae TaxID=1904757 RepID=A0A1X1P694_9BURK|nr:arsenic resistance N-acetyltransferase ArsN2 [Burkholderia puraquae]ORT80112.1 GNAT family N-acetyltransferase [Burkholderia puraquae]CAB3771061.1 Amino-acid acetyltransferase [Burkholderia puraquae]
MEIRPATVNDLASIEALLHRCGLPVVGVSDHLQDFVVAMEGSTMCGCGGIERYGDAALLRSIAVAEHARDFGLGQRIVSRLVATCRSIQIRSLVLLTTTAEHYFTRHGFIRVARDQVPPLVLASSQFQGVCPGSAVSMVRVL